jgi:hypothetical protein
MEEIQKCTSQPTNEYNHDGDIFAPAPQVGGLRVELPPEPPQLNPQAAKALLHLLMKARARPAAADRSEDL